MLKINYFASVREQLSLSSETLQKPAGVNTVEELTHWLSARGKAWEVLQSESGVLVALNQQVCTRDQRLGDHDEIAFFPPMTGG